MVRVKINKGKKEIDIRIGREKDGERCQQLLIFERGVWGGGVYLR